MSAKMGYCWHYAVVYTFCFLAFSAGQNVHEIVCEPNQMLEVDATQYPKGNLYSPGIKDGEPYPDSTKCGFQINATPGKNIRLKFNLIDIQRNMLCREDHLLIMNVDSNNSESYLTAAGMYCDNVAVPDLISTTHQVQVRFLSGLFGSGRGFNITYAVVSSKDLCLPGQFECRNRKCLSRDSLCNGDDECGDGTDEENCDLSPVVPETCGTPDIQPANSSGLFDRIVGGREVIRGSWPWQADLQTNILLPNGHFCGGTLLNTEWVFSAAHCMPGNRRPYEIRVHLGNHHKYEKDPYEQVRYGKEYYIFGVDTEQFIKDGVYDIVHDLVLIKLNAPVVISPHVKPACLPELNEELKVGQKCYATGWGITRGSGGTDVLKQAFHPIQSARTCDNEFQEFVNSSMICAGQLRKGFGLCHGDSGGPLVCQKGEKWHVYGAASFVIDSNLISGLCGIQDKPTVFNKLSAKMDWVKSILESNK
ncbi:chymotrypsin B-like [Uloborus diversus]|uniref:chymotrypsin B-like n=1 Tax=Uloborus diversus TaxID=327109 RepID=UPI0024091071|nr:chymotrypsin B-like [Uloborus diversus]